MVIVKIFVYAVHKLIWLFLRDVCEYCRVWDDISRQQILIYTPFLLPIKKEPPVHKGGNVNSLLYAQTKNKKQLRSVNLPHSM